jgi:hypothetical protein
MDGTMKKLLITFLLTLVTLLLLAGMYTLQGMH